MRAHLNSKRKGFEARGLGHSVVLSPSRSHTGGFESAVSFLAVTQLRKNMPGRLWLMLRVFERSELRAGAFVLTIGIFDHFPAKISRQMTSCLSDMLLIRNSIFALDYFRTHHILSLAYRCKNTRP